MNGLASRFVTAAMNILSDHQLAYLLESAFLVFFAVGLLKDLRDRRRARASSIKAVVTRGERSFGHIASAFAAGVFLINFIVTQTDAFGSYRLAVATFDFAAWAWASFLFGWWRNRVVSFMDGLHRDNH